MSKTSPVNAMITAVGHFVPEKVIDNKYFESFFWIRMTYGFRHAQV